MKTFLLASILLCVIDKLSCYLFERKVSTVCCQGLPRCYSDGAPFEGLPLPQCPQDMSISMEVYTRRNPSQSQSITRDSIPLVFNGSLLSMFIVHGWLQDEGYAWMHDMKNAALEQGDYNVIIVGWRGGAKTPWYPQSVSNTRTVGAEIALVSNNTILFGGSSRQRQYCVGHSLGGHVCGFAGQEGQFGRITGLDPAGPFYEDRDLSAGLNPSCADLVDVIHTNGRTLLTFGLGTLRRLGHVDFYPNKGSKQPGCVVDPFSGFLNLEDFLTTSNNSAEIGIDLALGCSHIRAYQFFTESILTPCFISRKLCLSQYDLPDTCSSEDEGLQSLGFHSNEYSGRGIFYLETNSYAPFCRG